MAMSGGIKAVGSTGSSKSSEGKSSRGVIEDQQNQILHKARQMGLTHEIREMLDDVENLRNTLRKKNHELDILEALAMESDNENIVVLREQLFTTVKLIHHDIVEEAINEYQNRSSIHDDREYEEDAPTNHSKMNKQSMDKQSLMEHVRRWYYNRVEIRKHRKQIKTIMQQHT